MTRLSWPQVGVCQDDLVLLCHISQIQSTDLFGTYFRLNRSFNDSKSDGGLFYLLNKIEQ